MAKFVKVETIEGKEEYINLDYVEYFRLIVADVNENEERLITAVHFACYEGRPLAYYTAEAADVMIAFGR